MIRRNREDMTLAQKIEATRQLQLAKEELRQLRLMVFEYEDAGKTDEYERRHAELMRICRPKHKK